MENKNQIVINRIFNAPVELIWKAWTDPEMAKKWWAPKDFTCSLIKIDFKVGGKNLNCMQGKMPDGKEVAVYSTGTYKEIIPMEKIVMSDSFADKDGNIVPASYYGMEEMSLELEVAVTFENLGNQTKMVLTHSGMQTVDDKMRTEMGQGWTQMFDKLDGIL
ncbi:MAG: SRPBCC domain-containing protein [Candidatus Doudnabacteria bacterium]|jgi:uncharacterized protein YndB with AHSA1/START domain